MEDVVALGALLIDFTPAGVSAQGAALMARNAGGAPANVLAMLAFVQLDEKGARSFDFYRKGSADVMLCRGENRSKHG